jgi:hypothetical protein
MINRVIPETDGKASSWERTGFISLKSAASSTTRIPLAFNFNFLSCYLIHNFLVNYFKILLIYWIFVGRHFRINDVLSLHSVLYRFCVLYMVTPLHLPPSH